MTTAEIAKKLVEYCRAGQNDKAVAELYSKDIVSLEASDTPNMAREMRGIDAISKKAQWWFENHIIHSAHTSGPFLATDKFSVVFDYDVTFKPTGKRNAMKEVAVYTVSNGKITHEEFLYAAE